MDKKYLLAIAASTLMLVACGDEVTELTEIHHAGMAVLGAGEKLSELPCDSANIGEIIFVQDSSEAFICDSKSWQTLKGENGVNGSNCSAKSVKSKDKTRDGIELTCGETVVDTIWNGKDGGNGDDGNNGTNCTAKSVTNKDKTRDGIELTCGETVVDTIWNGENGKRGDPGKPGEPGDAGSSCMAKSVENGVGLKGLELTCGETVVDTIWNGDDGNNGTSCTAKSVENGVGLKGLELTCGETVVDTIWNGKDGGNGDDGNNGTSCTAKSVTNKDKTRDGIELTCGETVVDTIWNGEKGDDGTNCTATMNEDGFDLVCGGESVGTIKNGKNGNNGNDGVGCSLSDNGDGTVTVTCGEGDDETITNIYKAVCGTKPYDPLKLFCSEGELYSCNDKPFDPKKQYCEQNSTVKDYGWLTDSRDNQVYKTVEICNNETSCQTWMAENLNYSVDPGNKSWCGGGSGATEGDCDLYGRLYTREAAQKACPDGWDLPSDDDWGKLIGTVGGDRVAGQKLKANSDLWTHKDGFSNDDSFGFAVLPAGYKFGSFHSEGEFALFWTATGIDNASLYFYYKFGYNSNSGDNMNVDVAVSISVRCLKN